MKITKRKTKMIKRLLVSISVLAFLMTIGIFCAESHAVGFADLPHNEKFIDIGFTGDKRDKSLDFAAVIPMYNGYAGAILSQGTQDGVLDSQTVVVRVQNGFKYQGLGLEGFLDYQMDQVAGVNTSEAGGFIRPAIVNWAGATISGGFGSYVENQAVRDDLGLESTDPETLPRLLGFVSVKYDAIPNTSIATLLKVAPSYSFDETKYSVDTTVLFDVSDRVGIVQTFHWEKDSDPIVESAGENYQIQLNVRIKL